MTILKGYTTIVFVLSFLVNIYNCGKTDDKAQVVTTIIVNIPMIIYLILS